MNNFEKIGLIVLFFISLIYSYIKPSDVVENIETKLNLLNPENILKKGYSLTLVEGKIVKSINSVKKGSIIDTKFSDGIIKSEVL